MTTTTSSISFDWPEEKDKKKDKNGHSINITRRGRPKTVTVAGDPGEPPRVGYPTAQAGIQVPYIIGRQRLFQPNTLWYGNLEVRYETEREVISKTIETESEEAGITVETPVTTIQETEFVAGYNLDVHMGLCLGPDVHLREIYIDNTLKWQGDAFGARTNIGNLLSEERLGGSFVFYDGRMNQNVAGGGEIVGVDIPGYVGIAVVTITGADATEVFPQISYEVERHPNLLGLANDVNVNAAGDINLMSAAADLIRNPWGGAGLGSNVIDNVSFTAAAIRLASEGNFCSLYSAAGGSGASMLKEIEDQMMGFFIRDPETDTIKATLIRYDLFDPDDADVLDYSNCVKLNEFGKRSWAGAASKAVATFTSRTKDYDEDIILALSPMFDSRRDTKAARYSYPMAMDSETASPLLARDMVIQNQPSWSGEVVVNRDASDWLPGHYAVLNWPEYNIEGLPVYVTSRREQAGDLSIVLGLAELINVNDNVLFAVPEPSLWNPPDRAAVSPTDAMVVTCPYWIQVQVYTQLIWKKKIGICTPIYLVRAYNNTQSTFDVRMLNYPDEASPPAGDQPVINKDALYASTGQLVADLTALDGFNDGIANTVLINGVIRNRYIKANGLAGVKEGLNLMFIEDEILSFEACSDEDAGVWELTNVHRGLMDTAPADHAAGTTVWIVNNNWEDRLGMTFDIVPEYIPELRFCSKTPSDRQKDTGLDYSDWTPDARINKPLRPVDTRLNGTRGSGTAFATFAGDTINVSWKSRSRNVVKKIAVFADASHAPEVSNSGVTQTHRVYLTDSLGNDYNLGETTSSPIENDLDVVVPSGVALGAGSIWVQARNFQGGAIQAERYPIIIS